MTNYILTDKEHEYKRINKTTARKKFNNGETIVISPCNQNPCSPWNCGLSLKPSWGKIKDFDKLVRDFEIYNCTDNETGKYASYYEVKDRNISVERRYKI